MASHLATTRVDLLNRSTCSDVTVPLVKINKKSHKPKQLTPAAPLTRDSKLIRLVALGTAVALCPWNCVRSLG